MAYPPERKAAVLVKMLPPNNMPLGRLAKEEGISPATLAKWRAEARARGRFLPDANAGSEGWSSQDKLAAVIETASLNETELGEYCRRRGIYPQSLRAWREACGRANDWERTAASRIARETRDDKKRIQQLERELARKEKALAEAAALMILRKRPMRSGGPQGGRGRMTSAADRRNNVSLIDEAMAAGARQSAACAELGLSERTLQRWTRPEGIGLDRRPFADRPEPASKLSEEERDRIVATCNALEIRQPAAQPDRAAAG